MSYKLAPHPHPEWSPALIQHIVRVALDLPIADIFDYLYEAEAKPPLGARVLVPWGRGQRIGLVWEYASSSEQASEKLKPMTQVLEDMPVLDAAWRKLIQTLSQYYHKPLGEVALSTMPALLRKAESYTDGRSRSMAMLHKRLNKWVDEKTTTAAQSAPTLNAAQSQAVVTIQAQLDQGFKRFLLHGITGSGKTEVYLQAIQHCLAKGKQALLLVPEINLTPQLEQELQKRFPTQKIAILHSGRSQGERAMAWLAAQNGTADLLVGTRLAVLTPTARLGLIVVDEEHDPSYKQQEGIRYSARDAAILRAQQLNIPVVLGSATPSLETWQRAQQGIYQLLSLPERAVNTAQPPRIEMVDTRAGKLQHGLSLAAEQALADNLARGETSLVFMNRRGYAPVLHCAQCGWVSQCRHCSVYSVFHKADGRLHCHHCGWQARVPKHCPDCGNVDLLPLGYGTQRVEDYLAERFPQARIIRIDADSTKGKAGAEPLLARVHAGEADILIGTQMVAKGHDFQKLTLVVALNADSALFAQDFRAPERLFAQLQQVAGRAGRDGRPSRMLIQSQYADHALYQALQAHDYAGFARLQLHERQSAKLPPYSYQVLLRAEAKTVAAALQFLQNAAALLPTEAAIRVYDPVPLNVVRVAGRERAQLLLESDSRSQLQAVLKDWLVGLTNIKSQVRWVLDVDPLEI